jgi:hypothetical protein
MGRFELHNERTMSELMTLKALVQRLEQLSPEGQATLKRQVRLWTEIGALPIANVMHVGSGKMRLYTEESLQLAAVAIELAAMGVQIGIIKGVLAGMLDYIRGKAPQVEWAMGDYRDVRLVVTMNDPLASPRASILIVEAGDAADYIRRDHAGFPRSAVIVVNLNRLWAQLR